MEKTKQYVTPYDFEGRLPLAQAIPLGLQHVLAMFVGNLTPILIITNLCAALGGGADFAAIQASLLQENGDAGGGHRHPGAAVRRGPRWAARCPSSWAPVPASSACSRAWST